MDFYGIKENVEAIRMPESARQEIAENLRKRKEYTMKPKSIRLAPIAAVLALCLMLPLGASAAGRMGFFRDITGWNGAIVGTAYENATEEIIVTAKAENRELLITVTLLKSQELPYREEETLALGSCYLTDEAGNRIAQWTGTDAVKITGPTLTFRLPMEEDAHTLHIENFVSAKKADQDLSIFGDWQIKIE